MSRRRAAAIHRPVLTLCLACALTASPGEAQDPGSLDARAIDVDTRVATAAQEQLRAQGEPALRELLRVYGPELERLLAHPESARDPRVQRIRRAVDRVSGQRDAFASGLFWYTDLAAAQAEARRVGRPILSLRLLGRLDEELSCANSRLFRTVLYPDPSVRRALADGFVLHWSSERPAPVITIDMGDGRRIVRTVTGNSIHYVMDADGHVIDALPGMMSASAFARSLTEARGTWATCRGDAACVRTRQQELRDALAARWQADAPRAGVPSDANAPDAGAPPTAFNAERISIGKASMELPMLQLMARAPIQIPATDEAWQRLAALHAEDAALSPESRAMVRFKQPNADPARVIARLGALVAEDTARNEHVRRRTILEWLSSGAVTDFTQLNTRVYTELFLTPRSDAWLGLQGDDVYTGLE